MMCLHRGFCPFCKNLGLETDWKNSGACTDFAASAKSWAELLLKIDCSGFLPVDNRFIKMV
jgi:hypothetical protein